jgi:hypothetical protein
MTTTATATEQQEPQARIACEMTEKGLIEVYVMGETDGQVSAAHRLLSLVTHELRQLDKALKAAASQI